MKKFLSLLIFAATYFSISAQTKKDETPYLTKPLSAEAINNVNVETSGGNIDLTAVDASQARLEVYVRQNNRQKSLSSEELKTKVESDYDLTISAENNKLTVTAKSKKEKQDWKNGLTFSFKVYTAKNAGCNLITSGGNISITGISGDKYFTTSGSNLYTESVEGKTKGTTSGGNIYLKNGKDDINLSTSGGNIYAENSTGTIKLSTSGGTIYLSKLQGKIDAGTSGGNVKGQSIEGELEAETSGGNISLQELSCSLKAATSAGNIDVSIKKLGDYVTLSNSGGKINVQIPRKEGVNLNLSAMKISTESLQNFEGTTIDNKIIGKLNGGGVPVNASTDGGNLKLGFN